MAHQFIVTMRDLRRVHPPDKEVLRGINISMYPGAKIGVLGLNGSGKSTLLRIMAGEDDGYSGEVRVTPGFSVGYLPQEPLLDPAKDVLGNVTDGVAHTKGLLDRFEEVCTAMGEPDADFDKLLAEQAELQTEIDAVNGWDLDRQLEIAMDALRLPPGDADVTKLSGGERRRVALCRLLLSKPDLLLLDEPTNHLDAESVAWLERHLHEYHGTVVAVTHDRYFLDNVAGWILELDRGYGIPWEGNYSSWLEQKDERLAQEEKVDEARRRTLARELEWVRMAPRARQAKGKARINAYDALVAEAESAERRDEKLQISIPPGPRLGDLVVEADEPAQGLRRPAADRRPLVHAAARRHRRRDRRERRRQDHALPHARRAGTGPTAGRSRSGRPSSSRTSTSRGSRSTRARPSTRRSPAASTTSRSATARCTAGRTSRASTSRAPTSRSSSATFRAASATGSTSRRRC